MNSKFRELEFILRQMDQVQDSSHPSPNIVGPDNVIAYNGGGIAIDSVQVAIFITANSIHDNGGAGIVYSDNPDGDPETILDPPSHSIFRA